MTTLGLSNLTTFQQVPDGTMFCVVDQRQGVEPDPSLRESDLICLGAHAYAPGKAGSRLIDTHLLVYPIQQIEPLDVDRRLPHKTLILLDAVYRQYFPSGIPYAHLRVVAEGLGPGGLRKLVDFLGSGLIGITPTSTRGPLVELTGEGAIALFQNGLVEIH